MKDGLEGLTLILVYGLVIVVIWAAMRRRPRPDETRAQWEETARRLGGRFFQDQDGRRVVFRWHGVEGELRLAQETMSLHLPLSGLDVARVEAVTGVAPGDVHFVVELPAMERFRWRIVALNKEDAERILSPQVRELLTELGADGREESVSLRVDGRGIRLTWPHTPDLTPNLFRALQIAQRAKVDATRDTGVRVIEMSATRGECQICGIELVGNVVRCAKCDTPHHRDCWAFARRCSTYACGSEDAR